MFSAFKVQCVILTCSNRKSTGAANNRDGFVPSRQPVLLLERHNKVPPETKSIAVFLNLY